MNIFRRLINYKLNVLRSVGNWIKQNRFEFALLLVILLVAAFLRLYRISDFMTFLGDEGRDVILVRRFVKNGDIMLIGPGTSIGNMYLGPLYYYMMAPALFLANYSPVGPAVMIALLGVITVWFVWFVSREWFGKTAAAISSLLYAIAPVVVIYSRSSWNPNIMPFFALLAIYAIWRVWKYSQVLWLVVAGVALAFCLQSHYLAMLLIPPVGLFWLLSLRKTWKVNKQGFVLGSVAMVLAFVLLMSPLAIFDYRHNYINFNAIKTFFSDRQSTVSIKPWKALPGMFPQLTFITGRLLTGYDVVLGNWTALLLFAGVSFALLKTKLKVNQTEGQAFFVLVAWIGFGLLGLALYKQHIYDHYYGFFFPAFFIALGGVLSVLSHTYRLRGRWLALTAVLVLVWINLSANPLQWGPNRQYPLSRAIGEFILDRASGVNFNFAVIAERNYEGAYQYFLEEAPNFRMIDPQNTAYSIAPQLFVVCEMPAEKCDPTHNSKAEIANFGWSKIADSWETNGVIIYKLIHAR